jgi:hypothetical protein
MMQTRSVAILGLTTLLFACAEQPTGYAPSYGSYGGSEYATPGYPTYGYGPGYPGPAYYGSDVLIGGGGYGVSSEDRDRYWYHRRLDSEQQLLRHQNEARTRDQVEQQLQQQKAAAQGQALQERAQAVQQLYQQRAQALAAQNQAVLQQRAAQQQAAARARGLAQ